MNYQALAITVDSLLTEFGQPITIVKHGTPTYNVTTGVNTFPEITFNTHGVMLDYESKFIDHTNILPSDRKLIVPTIGVSDLTADGDVVVGTRKYFIISLNEINPAGVVLGYELQIRAA